MGSIYAAAAVGVVGQIYGYHVVRPDGVVKASLHGGTMTGNLLMGVPQTIYTCAYCHTPRYDKAHNCRNCAGLEVMETEG